MEKLVKAISNNDYKTVENLLQNGLKPDFINKYKFNNAYNAKKHYSTTQ